MRPAYVGQTVLVVRPAISTHACPGLVTRLWGHNVVNVGGFDIDGRPFAVTQVCLLSPGEAPLAHVQAYAVHLPAAVEQARLETPLDRREAAVAPSDGGAMTQVQSAGQAFEEAMTAQAMTAPRVTFSDLTDNIVHTEVVKHITASGQILRWAVLTTRCGFSVAGKPSAAVSAENDREAIGRQIAIENAQGELWALMGYELRCRLAARRE